MRYCICASKGAARHEPVLYRGDYADAFDYAKDMGFDGVEIHLRAADDVDAAQLLEQSKRTGIHLAAIATGLAKRLDGLELVDREQPRRQAAIDRIKRHADLADHFGCQIIIGSMRGNIALPATDAETRALLMESMREIAAYIADKNCGVVFEAINRYENNYLNTAAETVAFVQALGSPKVKVLLDTFHMNIEERCFAEAIRMTAENLGHIHMADNTRMYPGSGTVNFAEVLRALESIGYAGWVSLEYLPLPDEKTASERGISYMRALAECRR